MFGCAGREEGQRTELEKLERWVGIRLDLGIKLHFTETVSAVNVT